MKNSTKIIITPWGRMRTCPTCPVVEPGDNEWFLSQFDGRTCRACKHEAEAAKGSRIRRGATPLALEIVSAALARYKQGGITYRALGAQLGISARSVGRIVNGDWWQDVRA